MPDVIIVGSCVQDLVSYTPRFPNPGESVRGSKFASGFGGKGANQAVASARLGANTAIVAKVGDDIFGPPTIRNFQLNNVDCGIVTPDAFPTGAKVTSSDFSENVLVTSDASTATATITVCDTGQNSIVVVLGANELLSAEDVRNAESLIKNSKVMCCQLEIKTEVTLEAMKIAKMHGAFQAEFLSGMTLSDLDDGKKIVSHLLTLGPKTVVITLGEKGCLYATTESPEPKLLDCPRVKAKDTTGAGDAFVGSLAYFIALKPSLSLYEKIERSCQIASVSVQNLGTQSSYPWKNDLDPNLFC